MHGKELAQCRGLSEAEATQIDNGHCLICTSNARNRNSPRISTSKMWTTFVSSIRSSLRYHASFNYFTSSHFFNFHSAQHHSVTRVTLNRCNITSVVIHRCNSGQLMQCNQCIALQCTQQAQRFRQKRINKGSNAICEDLNDPWKYKNVVFFRDKTQQL